MTQVQILSVQTSTTVNFNTGAAGGVEYICSQVEGWDAGDVRMSVLPLVGLDREVVTEAKLAARSLGISGVVECTSEALMWTAWNTLLNAFESVTINGELRVWESTTKLCYVRRNRPPRFTRFHQNKFGFTAQFIAPDPLKYSNPLHLDEAPGVIVNEGDRPVVPSAIYFGECDSPVLANENGQYIGYTGHFDDLMVYPRQGYATEAGELTDRQDPYSDFFPLRPGANGLFGTQCVVEHRWGWA